MGRVAGQRLFIEEVLQRERGREGEGLSNEDRLLGDGPLFQCVCV